MTAYTGHRSDQGEEPDHAQCPSDISMEDDDDEESPNKSPPPAQLDKIKRYAHGNTKSGGQFMGKVERVIGEGTEWIKWDVEGSGAIWIPNNRKFLEKILPEHFSGIKVESFEKQLRSNGYRKKKTARGTEGSLWVRKDAPQSKDAAPQDMVQERPPTTSASFAANMAPRPSDQPDLEARMDELQNKLSTTTSDLNATKSELDATRSELKETRDLLSDTRSEVKILTNLLRQLFGRDSTTEPVSTRDGPSHPMPNFGRGPVVAHGPSQMIQTDAHDGIPYRSLLTPQAGAYGVTAPQGAPLGLGIPPSYNPVGPAFPSEQPARPKPSGYGFEVNPGITRPYSGGHTRLGGPFPGHSWVQQSDMPQVAGTSSGHQQTSIIATGAPLLSDYCLPIPDPQVTSAYHATTRGQLSNHSRASGKAKTSTGPSVVPSPANPDNSNDLQQAQFR